MTKPPTTSAVHFTESDLEIVLAALKNYENHLQMLAMYSTNNVAALLLTCGNCPEADESAHIQALRGQAEARIRLSQDTKALSARLQTLTIG